MNEIYNTMIFQVFWDHKTSLSHSFIHVVLLNEQSPVFMWFRSASAVIAYPLCLMTTIHTGRLISRVRIGC